MEDGVGDDLLLGVESFFSLGEVPFSDLFESAGLVWESLLRRDDYIRDNMRSNIDRGTRNDIPMEGDVHIGEGTVIEPGAYIKGPAIIGRKCQIRHGAYIRGHVITGDQCVIGHTTEVIRSILLNNVRADHFAYIGDSILGNDCHLGAGVILANVKMRMNPSSVKIRVNGHSYDTGMRKLGCIMGDNAEIGCNSVANPGTVLEKGVAVYPGTVLRGYYASGTIVKGSAPPERPPSLALLESEEANWMEQILCPNCGERITSVGRVRDMVSYCKEFWGQCSCGQRYNLRLSCPDNVVLTFPDRQEEIVC